MLSATVQPAFIRSFSYQISEYIEHPSFDSYRLKFTESTLRTYMRKLLKILNTVHTHGIIHRDIKPSNIFYNPENESMKLGDFGQSIQFNPDKPMSPDVAARFFKAPELLLKMDYYFYAVDIWAAGVIFASIVT